GAQRLGQDVVDASGIQDGADGTAGDDTGTRRGRTQQHDAGGVLGRDRVRDRLLDAGDAEEVLLRLLDTLRDGRGDLLGLAVAHADHAIAIAHDDECSEGEATAALHHLRHAVDRDDVLDELALLLAVLTVAATAPALTATTAAATAAIAGVGLLLRLALACDGLGRLVLFGAHSASPPSRAPSATAATRPW